MCLQLIELCLRSECTVELQIHIYENNYINDHLFEIILEMGMNSRGK